MEENEIPPEGVEGGQDPKTSQITSEAASEPTSDLEREIQDCNHKIFTCLAHMKDLEEIKVESWPY